MRQGFRLCRVLVRVTLASALAALALTSHADNSSTVVVYAGNVDEFGSPHPTTLAFDSNDTGAALEARTGRAFLGLDPEGTFAQMSITGLAYARATGLSLGVAAELSAYGVISHPRNPPLVLPDGSVLPFGVPSYAGTEAIAFGSDLLQVQSAIPVASVRLVLQLDGAISGDGLASDGAHQLSVLQTDASGIIHGGSNNLNLLSTPGYHDISFLSKPIPVHNGLASFGLYLNALVQVDLSQAQLVLPGDRYGVGSVGFAHTLNITGVQGLDAQGGLVALQAVSGATGLQYPVVAVPEPGTAALWIAGLLLALVRRRSKPARPI